VVRSASSIRTALGFHLEAQRRLPTWTDAMRRFIELADALGVLVMVSGVVGSNNQRPLDPEEFRGFALADPLAPLVFINGADTKAAQMFTLAHELAHLWLGESALSDACAAEAPTQVVERWCNRVAAEMLIPLSVFSAVHDPEADLRGELDRLARRFKVSTLVVLRRMHDASSLMGDAYWRAYNAEVERLQELSGGSGGNFYLTLGARVWIVRYDIAIIIVNRFLYGFRIAAPVALGTSAVPVWRFLVFNIAGAIIWTVVIGGAGYLFGSALEKLLEDVRWHDQILIGLVLLLGISLWIGRYIARRVMRGG
jgi:Zn-dependent peptidase ImmA (M78 family)